MTREGIATIVLIIVAVVIFKPSFAPHAVAALAAGNDTGFAFKAARLHR